MAVQAASDIVAALETSEFHGHRLRLRIGIATGPVAAGTVVSDERLSFTSHGDTVNLSQRLESLNKEVGTTCHLSKATYDAVQHDIEGIRALGAYSLRTSNRRLRYFCTRLNNPVGNVACENLDRAGWPSVTAE
ncbi:adenylate/guanylate cyclase domain-containing protein [Mesorhizobium sp. B283B1A]|nr:adenylate/guanylate cyclase domain-containing protein [Mesorhizobium sp. B283B1A]